MRSRHNRWNQAVPIFLWITALLFQFPLHADSGVVRLRSAAGPWTFTLFTPADLSSATSTELAILVQQSDNGELLLDPVVKVRLIPPAGAPVGSADVFCGPMEELPPSFRAGGAGTPWVIQAVPGRLGNPFLHGIRVRLPWPGDWGIRISVRHGVNSVSVDGILPVGGPAQRLRTVWPSLLFPPMAIVLFAVNRALRRQRE